MIGKIASCAAMALTFGSYAAPGPARPLAVGAVVCLTAVNLLGIQKTAWLTRLIVTVVLASLATVVTASLTVDQSTAGIGPLTDGGVRGILQAGGLLFFAFAGYARIATLGEEVHDPARTIPRATSVPATSGAEVAFSRYVLPEVDVLYRVALSTTRNKADAEDLVQDTVLRAFRSIERFDDRHPRAWLLTIMRNAQINRVRRRRPGLLADPDEAADRSAGMADDAAGPEQLVMDRQFDSVVQDAYLALLEKFREVIDLVDLAGLSYDEAAAVVESPQGTVMSRLHRGRKRP